MTPGRDRAAAYRERKRAGIILHKPTLQERFDAKVDKNDPSGCWRWLASFRSTGYGQITVRGYGYPRGAHQVSYVLHCGPIPAGMDVCHSCDNRWCVNPAHLWVGTRQQNLHDAINKGRLQPFGRLMKVG